MFSISSRVAAPPAGHEAGAGVALKGKVANSKLGFYHDFPIENIALDDFEQFAIDRLQGG